MTDESAAGIRKSNHRWQSDVIVDLIKHYDFPYVALNPGASFRGLHDSLVNYGENDPHAAVQPRKNCRADGSCPCTLSFPGMSPRKVEPYLVQIDTTPAHCPNPG